MRQRIHYCWLFENQNSMNMIGHNYMIVNSYIGIKFWDA